MVKRCKWRCDRCGIKWVAGLGYRTKVETPFVFNVEVQSYGSQIVEHEQLTLPPGLKLERWVMPESGNRYLRVLSPPGELILNYEATVSFTPRMDDPASVIEINAAELPLQVFPHLYPSRYCQSDKLERFARSTFGTLDAGYTRVNGICNWIYDYVFYEGGVSDALTSAFDTVTQRAGRLPGLCASRHSAMSNAWDSGALCQRLCIPA